MQVSGPLVPLGPSVAPSPSSHLAVAALSPSLSWPDRGQRACLAADASRNNGSRLTAGMQPNNVKYRVITAIHAITRPTGCGTRPGANTGVISLGSRWRPKFRAQRGRPPSSTHRVLSTSPPVHQSTSPGPDRVHQLRISRLPKQLALFSRHLARPRFTTLIHPGTRTRVGKGSSKPSLTSITFPWSLSTNIEFAFPHHPDPSASHHHTPAPRILDPGGLGRDGIIFLHYLVI